MSTYSLKDIFSPKSGENRLITVDIDTAIEEYLSRAENNKNAVIIICAENYRDITPELLQIRNTLFEKGVIGKRALNAFEMLPILSSRNGPVEEARKTAKLLREGSSVAVINSVHQIGYDPSAAALYFKSIKSFVDEHGAGSPLILSATDKGLLRLLTCCEGVMDNTIWLVLDESLSRFVHEPEAYRERFVSDEPAIEPADKPRPDQETDEPAPHSDDEEPVTEPEADPPSEPETKEPPADEPPQEDEPQPEEPAPPETASGGDAETLIEKSAACNRTDREEPAILQRDPDPPKPQRTFGKKNEPWFERDEDVLAREIEGLELCCRNYGYDLQVMRVENPDGSKRLCCFISIEMKTYWWATRFRIKLIYSNDFSFENAKVAFIAERTDGKTAQNVMNKIKSSLRGQLIPHKYSKRSTIFSLHRDSLDRCFSQTGNPSRGAELLMVLLIAISE